MEKINIAELLKDCPKGMELDCSMYDDLVFVEVDLEAKDYPITTQLTNGTQRWFTSDGRYELTNDAKCVIFPKGRTTWEGFVPPCKFKDGDIIFTHANCLKVGVGNTWISIFKEKRNGGVATYVDYAEDRSDYYSDLDGDKALLCMESDILRQRFATEEEKEKLFKAIEDNGYKWNPETKTLEKLIEPKFKDGDIITDSLGTCIFKGEGEFEGTVNYYCGISNDYFRVKDDKCNPSGHYGYIVKYRLATEEEKQKLFDAIKANGYKWNAETKTLEDLTESKEDVDDEILMSGIYFDRKYHADEVELHLGNYEIEIRDGRTYAVLKNQKTKTFELPKFKDGDVLFVDCSDDEENELYQFIFILKKTGFDRQWHAYCHLDEVGNFSSKETYLTYDKYHPRFATEEEKAKLFDAIKANGYKWNEETKTLEKLVEPKFKVGDRIKYIYFDRKVAKVVKIHDKRYELDNGKFLEFQDENAYEISYDKFDISTLIPFESKVLVRDTDYEEWRGAFWGHLRQGADIKYDTLRGVYSQCIPYNDDTKHLLGKTNDCDEYFKTWK